MHLRFVDQLCMCFYPHIPLADQAHVSTELLYSRYDALEHGRRHRSTVIIINRTHRANGVSFLSLCSRVALKNNSTSMVHFFCIPLHKCSLFEGSEETSALRVAGSLLSLPSTGLVFVLQCFGISMSWRSFSSACSAVLGTLLLEPKCLLSTAQWANKAMLS